MSQKRWKLVLSELGSAVTLQETVVEAGDWMTALTRARGQIGERGGVPPGASCSIAPDGKATIVDAVARRKYSLTPTTDALPAPPVAAPAPAPEPPAKPAGKQKVSKATVAYMASPVARDAPAVAVAVGAPASVAPAAAPSSVAPAAASGSVAPVKSVSEPPRPVSVPRPSDRPAKPNKTVSYSTAEVREAAELYAKSQEGLAAAAAQTASAAPAAQAQVAVAPPAAAGPVAAPAAPGPQPKKKVARQTMAYLPDDVAKAIANQAGVVVGAPSTTPAAPPASVASAVAPASVAPASVAPAVAASVAPAVAPASVAPAAVAPAQPPPPAASAPDPLSAQLASVAPARAPAAAPASAPPEPARASQPVPDGTELLHSRDAEPTKESPLIYRERHYLVPAGLGDDEAEMILRRKFAALREELASRPKGKLVKMALFDHRFTTQPLRPPVLALQWKDWRGEPELIAPGRMSMPAASMAPPPAAAPVAPLAAAPVSAPPVASAPVASAPVASAPVAQAPVAHAPVAQAAAPVAAPSPSTPPPANASSIIVDASAYAPSSPTPAPATPPEATPSIVVDAIAYTPSEPPPPRTQAAPASARPATATPAAGSASTRRSRNPTPGAALTDDRLADAFEGLQDLFFLTSAFEGVEFAVRLIGELIPSEAISVALYDINTNELRFVSTTGIGAEERKGDAVPIDAGLLGAAVNDWTRCLVVPDVAADGRFDPGIDGRVGLDATNMLIMPVAAQARLLALVQLSNRIGDLQYSQSDANLIQYIGGRLAEFLLQTKMTADRPSKRAPAASR